ncbi:hypothetical protein AAEX63_05570 [Luteococcus sp. H138]|uniref:hypothetical protein n=1 Tax=unclassified Luteococcus TaxID=2639923 RepID=UPI00313E7A6E
MPEQRVVVWRLPHLVLSFRMMGGALVASGIALLLSGLAGWFLAGSAGLLSGLLGAVAVVAFLGGGTPVQLAAMGQGSQQAVGLVLISYVSRVAMLGLVLLALGPGRSHWSPDSNCLAVGVVLTTIAWIAGLIVTHARSRIPIYDTDYSARDKAGE